MAQVQLSAEQASVVAAWSLEGSYFVPLVIQDRPMLYACDWRRGEVLSVQGDSYAYTGPAGQVNGRVSPSTEGPC
jgi:hypothetical protein